MVEDKKASTINSMFLGSTLEKPNVELIINAVATILHSQMLEVSTTNLYFKYITIMGESEKKIFYVFGLLVR